MSISLDFIFGFFPDMSFYSSPINCLCIVDNCVLATGDDDGYVKVNEKKLNLFEI